jgi:hypothetical protein
VTSHPQLAFVELLIARLTQKLRRVVPDAAPEAS